MRQRRRLRRKRRIRPLLRPKRKLIKRPLLRLKKRLIKRQLKLRYKLTRRSSKECSMRKLKLFKTNAISS